MQSILAKTQDRIADLIRRRSLDRLQQMSQHDIDNAFYKIRFGLHNKQSIHGACPMEMLHAMLSVKRVRVCLIRVRLSNRSKWTKMAEEIRKNHPNKVKFLAKEQKEGSVKDPDVVYIVMKGDKITMASTPMPKVDNKHLVDTRMMGTKCTLNG